MMNFSFHLTLKWDCLKFHFLTLWKSLSFSENRLFQKNFASAKREQILLVSYSPPPFCHINFAGPKKKNQKVATLKFVDLLTWFTNFTSEERELSQFVICFGKYPWAVNFDVKFLSGKYELRLLVTCIKFICKYFIIVVVIISNMLHIT